jgi:hypothetical protein
LNIFSQIPELNQWLYDLLWDGATAEAPRCGALQERFRIWKGERTGTDAGRFINFLPENA